MTTRSHSSSTSVIWWVENMMAAPSLRSRETASFITRTFTGSRPENGSSRTMKSGSCRMVAANCVELPEAAAQFADLLPPVRLQAEEREQLVRAPERALARHPFQRGEVEHVGDDAEAAVEAALLRQVANARLGLLADRRAEHGDGALVRTEDVQQHADGGGLPRAVRPHESRRLRPGSGRGSRSRTATVPAEPLPQSFRVYGGSGCRCSSHTAVIVAPRGGGAGARRRKGL